MSQAAPYNSRRWQQELANQPHVKCKTEVEELNRYDETNYGSEEKSASQPAIRKLNQRCEGA